VPPSAQTAGYSGTPLVKKLGIKPGDQLALVNEPLAFPRELVGLPPNVEMVGADDNPKPGTLNVVVLFLKSQAELKKLLPAMRSKIAHNGMIWAAWPKKTSRVKTDLDENVIRDAGLSIGLVDIKVCAVNDIWSGLKFVVPVKDRKK
jgi:hypothetical protein